MADSTGLGHGLYLKISPSKFIDSMGKFRTSTIIAMASPQTLQFLKRTRLDMQEILNGTRDISGTPIPEDLELNLTKTHWDFCLLQESSMGMEFTVESRYGPNLDCLTYLCYKFPDLRVRLTFQSYDTDGFFDLVWIARTRDGKVQIQEAYWDEDYIHGCGFGEIPDFYERYTPGVYLEKNGHLPCQIKDEDERSGKPLEEKEISQLAPSKKLTTVKKIVIIKKKLKNPEENLV